MVDFDNLALAPRRGLHRLRWYGAYINKKASGTHLLDACARQHSKCVSPHGALCCDRAHPRSNQFIYATKLLGGQPAVKLPVAHAVWSYAGYNAGIGLAWIYASVYLAEPILKARNDILEVIWSDRHSACAHRAAIFVPPLHLVAKSLFVGRVWSNDQLHPEPFLSAEYHCAHRHVETAAA